MDATEQLSLKEDLRRQLGIVTYHPNVSITTGRSTVRVPMVSVCLLKSVKVPPRVSICVHVQIPTMNGVRMVEPDLSLESKQGLHLSPTLIDLRRELQVLFSASILVSPAHRGSRAWYTEKSGDLSTTPLECSA